jgi:RNA polymerase sigma factor (sigma-70 family)
MIRSIEYSKQVLMPFDSILWKGTHMTTITHYTTHDLDYFYSDLHRLPPRLSPEEQRALLDATPPQATHLEQQARNRLVEAHLGLALHIAVRLCPADRYASSFPDLLGEVFLALIQTADRYNVRTGGDVTLYLGVNAEWAVRRALDKEKLVRVPRHALTRARQQGREQALYDLQPQSLDAWMERYEMDGVEEVAMRPLIAPAAAPERDPALRAQVEIWLSHLSAHEQTILRLRFGLSDQDERAYSVVEIARLCGVKPVTMAARLRTALSRLKAIAQGAATLSQKQGSPRVTGGATLTSAEQDVLLMQVATRMQSEGRAVSTPRLVQASGLGRKRVTTFLQAHRDRFPANVVGTVLHHDRLVHVAAVYAEQVAQGKRITSGRQLARLAQVGNTTALEFLRALEGSSSHATA